MAAEGHAPQERVKEVILIHAEDDSNRERLVRPIADTIADYCKLPSQTEFKTHFSKGQDVGKIVLEQMKKSIDSSQGKSGGRIHTALLLSKKFLQAVSKNKDVHKKVEELLLADKNGTIFALVWIDECQNDIGMFSTKLANQWKEKKTFPGIQAGNYREYHDDYKALAEAVYKIWNGSGTYIEKPNHPMSSREARMSEPRREPVESLDPTCLDVDSTRPTIGNDGHEGLFMLQDKMSSNENDNVAVHNLPNKDETKKEGVEVKSEVNQEEGQLAIGAADGNNLFDKEDLRSSRENDNVAVHDVPNKDEPKKEGVEVKSEVNQGEGQLAIGAADGNNLFDKEDQRSPDQHGNVACNPDTAAVEKESGEGSSEKVIGVNNAPDLFNASDQHDNVACNPDPTAVDKESGEGSSEKVIGVNNAPDLFNGLEPDCNGKDSMPHQSDGCNSIQSASQDPSISEPDPLHGDSTLPIHELDRANQDKGDSNKDNSKNKKNELTVNAKCDVDETRLKKPVEEQSPIPKDEPPACGDPDCQSKDKVIPESQFFSTNTSSSSIKLMKDLDQDTKDEIMYLLDPPCACVKDWRHLASRKGVGNTKITFWEKKGDSGTICYLNYLASKHPKYTVAEFKKDIEDISRMDVLDLLEELKL